MKDLRSYPIEELYVSVVNNKDFVKAIDRTIAGDDFLLETKVNKNYMYDNSQLNYMLNRFDYGGL